MTAIVQAPKKNAWGAHLGTPSDTQGTIDGATTSASKNSYFSP